MADLFGICSSHCNCRAGSCSLKEGQFADLARREVPPCSESATCTVCQVFGKHLGLCSLLSRASVSKAARMSQLLASSVAVLQIYALSVTPELLPAARPERKRTVKRMLCTMLDCKMNKLQCLKHIGQLAEMVPKLLCVQLTSGYSLFWDQLRKVARTVNAQPNRESKLAALVAIRRKLPVDSPWKAFLTSESTAEEEAICGRFTRGNVDQ